MSRRDNSVTPRTTTTDAQQSSSDRHSRVRALLYAASDAAVIAKRNVIKIKRVPDVLVFVLISPIMFVLLFAFVFGNSINIPGGSYREFLIAGIFAQTVVFGATFTGAGLADDIQKGIINRFRRAADVAQRAAGGAHGERRGVQRAVAADHGADRTGGGLGDPAHRCSTRRRASPCCWRSPTRSRG